MPLRARSSDPYGSFAARPRASAVAGALAIAFSAPLVRLANTEPTSAAVFRCAYALPALWVLARIEHRRFGPRPRRDRAIGWTAGAFLAADLVAWHRSIDAVGAGLATVLANLQVVAVAVLAWAILRERPSGRLLASMPVAIAGVLLISGVLETGAYGRDPALGVVFGLLTAVAYAGFLLTHRRGSHDLRRLAGPLFDVSLAAAASALALGLLLGGLELVPSWPAHGWLLVLALETQVAGWLLISISLPRLPASLTSVLLLVQSVGSVLLSMALFGEAPSALQLTGVALVLAAVVTAAARRAAGAAIEPAPEGAVTTTGRRTGGVG
jgi:drug/metabolite transporter (DMT)-like permease